MPCKNSLNYEFHDTQFESVYKRRSSPVIVPIPVWEPHCGHSVDHSLPIGQAERVTILHRRRSNLKVSKLHSFGLRMLERGIKIKLDGDQKEFWRDRENTHQLVEINSAVKTNCPSAYVHLFPGVLVGPGRNPAMQRKGLACKYSFKAEIWGGVGSILFLFSPDLSSPTFNMNTWWAWVSGIAYWGAGKRNVAWNVPSLFLSNLSFRL